MSSRLHGYAFVLVLSAMIVGCGDDSKNAPDNTPSGPQTEPQNHCGDGQLSDGEACDGTLGVPASCSDINGEKQWQPGGKPACSSDCSAITLGSCVEVTPQEPEEPEPQPVCGDGQITGKEVCDGELGVPATCSEYNGRKRWKDGGKPVCASNCMSLEAGTCVENTAECGNRVREDDEVCDGMDGIPLTCSEFDDSKQWNDGGMPACSRTCDKITQGSCTEFIPEPEPVCGDGEITGDEICDSEEGVPGSCRVLSSDIQWKEGGRPACAEGCRGIAYGTCEALGVPNEIVIMNWNVLFEWTDWGGREVLPRAQKLHDIVEKYPKKPV